MPTQPTAPTDNTGCVHSLNEVLDWAHELLDPALRSSVDRLPNTTRHIVGYHFGWCDVNGRASSSGAGKRLRPALCLLTAAAAGDDARAALPAAVAIEHVHNFSLLHDDIIDGDARRRHRPTAWAVFGRGPALLAGDSLLAAAFGELAASRHERAADGLRALSAALLDLVAGQDLDLAFEQREDVGMAECVQMARAKTGALLGCACALGGMFAGADAKLVKRLHDFGMQLGLAFQLVDDLLGIWGDPAVTGKPVHADLSRRKKSLPVVAALGSHTDAGAEFTQLYQREDALSAAELAHAAALIERAGARAWAEAEADRELRGALDDLRSADLAGPAVEKLTALAQLLTTRDR